MPVFRVPNSADVTDRMVPHPRGPYPIGEPYDGPTERLYDAATDDSEIDDDQPPAEPRPARRSTVIVAITLAVIALLASGAAALIAWRALAVAGATAARAPTPSPVAGPEPSASADPSVSADPSAAADPSAGAGDGPAGQASPGASDGALPGPAASGYVISYAREQLTVPVGCAAVTYVDLDEPTAESDEQPADLRYDSRCGDETPTLTLGAGAESGARVTDPDTDAVGCDEAIRTAPLAAGTAVPAKKGTVLCVLTSATDAVARSAEAQMVLVEITGVTPEGSASIRATSWAVP
jgi:hypothetical protein